MRCEAYWHSPRSSSCPFFCRSRRATGASQASGAPHGRRKARLLGSLARRRSERAGLRHWIRQRQSCPSRRCSGSGRTGGGGAKQRDSSLSGLDAAEDQGTSRPQKHRRSERALSAGGRAAHHQRAAAHQDHPDQGRDHVSVRNISRLSRDPNRRAQAFRPTSIHPSWAIRWRIGRATRWWWT